ncbi:hypothetical protein H5P28_18285 [Ruficoccus amylovorans]|uniref:Uncharacterized protein n=1 Tax=Ruficoccus amylovorans TaxID=1804625 RepID=A0A842HMB1_9BACT|nr:HpsJ family protein [Ruficoccus amylovorans]MBC2596221.1 hypothetical protein [Ruficoccus amylovorans]
MSSSLLSLPPDDRTTARSYLRIVGWALLVLGLIDYAYILLGTDWMNPVSEMRTAGRLAEHVLLPLLGVLLLLIPAGDKFTPAEARARARLGKLSLLLAVLNLALVPFVLISGIRIHRALDKQTTAWVEKQEQMTQGAIGKLNDKRSREDVVAFVQPLPLDENMFFEPDLQVLKGNLAERFNEINTGNIERAESSLSARLRQIWTDAFKWTVTALIGAAAFWLIGWKSRRYARLAAAARHKK